MKVKTIKVANKDAKNGYMLINESDFDKAIHKEFKESAKKPAAKKKPAKKAE